MISLEIAISSLAPTHHTHNIAGPLSLRFGSINTNLSLTEGHGGKCLYLDLTPEEVQQLYSHYACGLFLEQERCFSLISLEKVLFGEKVICQPIAFVNDLRQTKYTGEFSIVSQVYKNPKIANTTKIVSLQTGVNMLKKPSLPKQSPPHTKHQQNRQANTKKQINSFLYGGSGNQKQQVSHPVNSDNLKTMKQGLRKQNQIIKQLQTSQNKFKPASQKALAKQTQSQQLDDLLDSNPPMMQFTNNGEQQDFDRLKVPQVQHIEFADSIERDTQKKVQLNAQNQYTFAKSNRKDKQEKRRESPTTPSEFQLIKKDSKVLPPKPTGLSKSDIKALAKQQAQAREVRNNMLIPMAKGDKFQLVPLSNLKPDQIIDYVQKQRKNQAEASKNKERQRKLEQQQKQMAEKNKKLALLMERKSKEKENEKQKELQLQRRQSKDIRNSVTQQIKEEANDSEDHAQESLQDSYLSDFESASVSNSAIKSRLSSRGQNRSNMEKEQTSAIDDEYSSEFQDYSQSMMSKGKSNNKAQSISDISDSYHSISVSQSYRK